MKSDLIDFLKQHPLLMDVVAFFYNCFHNNSGYLKCIIKNGVTIRAFMRNTKIVFTGNRAMLYIGRRTQLSHCSIILSGNNTSLFVAGGDEH